jgi:HD-like signal output (HDOD) protein/CheY-like chemotaxis protein
MNSKPRLRLLFVDDDPSILQMLQMIVQTLEPAWETEVADSGTSALRMMERQTFDVIISDMGMPGMTGAQLLNEVMRRFPKTGRIILSGYAEQDGVLRSIGAMHQFLPKPFAIPAFREALHRICGLRERLRTEELQKLVPHDGSLPTIPAAYFKILEAPDGRSGAERVAEALSSDPRLTRRLLDVVNSSSLGPGHKVTDALDAVNLLGIGIIRTLVLFVHLSSGFKPPQSDSWSTERLCHHSLGIGRCAEKIAQLETGNETLAEQSFAAGLFHEIGRLLLAQNFSATYVPLIVSAAQKTKPLVELEREAFGATHAEAGAGLLDFWGLPVSLIEAVALQYEPDLTTDPVLSPLTFLHVANVLDEASRTNDPEDAVLRLDSTYLDKLGLSGRISAWQQAVS